MWSVILVSPRPKFAEVVLAIIADEGEATKRASLERKKLKPGETITVKEGLQAVSTRPPQAEPLTPHFDVGLAPDPKVIGLRVRLGPTTFEVLMAVEQAEVYARMILDGCAQQRAKPGGQRIILTGLPSTPAYDKPNGSSGPKGGA